MKIVSKLIESIPNTVATCVLLAGLVIWFGRIAYWEQSYLLGLIPIVLIASIAYVIARCTEHHC